MFLPDEYCQLLYSVEPLITFHVRDVTECGGVVAAIKSLILSAYLGMGKRAQVLLGVLLAAIHLTRLINRISLHLIISDIFH